MRPSIITSDEIQMAIENNLLFPKLLTLLLFAFMIWRFNNRIRWREPFVILLLFHWALVTLSTLSTYDEWTFKLLGGQYRMDGWVYQTALISLGIGAYSFIRFDLLALTFFTSGFLIGCSLQSVIMMLQRWNLDLISPIVRFDANFAPTGTLTHPGMMAGLLTSATLLGVNLYKSLPVRVRPWWIFGLLLTAIGLSITNNRASLYGIVVGLAFCCLYQRSRQTLLLSVLSLSVILGAREILPNPQGFVRSLEDSRTFEIRIHIWETAFSALKTMPWQPWLGGGPDGFRLQLLRNPPIEPYLAAYGAEVAWPRNAKIASVKRIVRDPLRRSALEVKFSQFGDKTNHTLEVPLVLDRAHNLWFDRALSYGVLDALLWIALYLMPIWWALRSWRKPNSQAMVLGFTTLGLAVYYLVWFPVIQVEPLHVTVLAFAWAQSRASIPAKADQESSSANM